MIGVAVPPSQQEAAREFFELWKTPWESCRDGGQYDVLICTGTPPRPASAPLVLAFSGTPTGVDEENRLAVRPCSGGTVLSYAGRRLPIYGAAATFPGSPPGLVAEPATAEAALHARRAGEATVVRIGYDLFEEVRFLLATGQPAGNAGVPTLELHIALVRDLVTRAGLPVVEIPPAPPGQPFIACLTHDIDHPRLRSHGCDHTMFGFLYRATVGSLIAAGRGRLPVRRLARNVAAAARLPFVLLGWARDFWGDFDRYLEIEAGRGSTFFVIATRDDPGQTAAGAAPARRAARYALDQVTPQLQRIVAAGGEVGLHGLDAWRSAEAGRREREQMTRAVAAAGPGVRMHWLYFDGDSPARLEAAGFSYDSTVGYNETVGYRAGTTQAYRPPGATTLLELPLHVMDTALFFPGHLHLGEDEARRRVWAMMDDVSRAGGVLTFNWHDRSIAPERLWGDFYRRLLQELSRRNAWFATAGQAVAWFRKRRQAAVEAVRTAAGAVRVRGRLEGHDALPGLTIRVHSPCVRTPVEPLSTGPAASFVDLPFGHNVETTLTL